MAGRGSRVRWGIYTVLIVAIVAVTAVAVRSVDHHEPVPITEADLGTDNMVEVWIDRCGSEPRATKVFVEGDRLQVEIEAKQGSDETCADGIEVAIITDDIFELEDLTSGEVFVLRTPPSEGNRPPVGTRE